MAVCCKRISAVISTPIPAGGELSLPLPGSTIEYVLRVVDAASFAGVAFSLAYSGQPTVALHFAAGEGYQEERLALDADLELVIRAVAGARAELITWAA